MCHQTILVAPVPTVERPGVGVGMVVGTSSAAGAVSAGSAVSAGAAVSAAISVGAAVSAGISAGALVAAGASAGALVAAGAAGAVVGTVAVGDAWPQAASSVRIIVSSSGRRNLPIFMECSFARKPIVGRKGQGRTGNRYHTSLHQVTTDDRQVIYAVKLNRRAPASNCNPRLT